MNEKNELTWSAERGEKIEIPEQYTRDLKFKAVYTLGGTTFTAWSKGYSWDDAGPRLTEVIIDTSQRVQGVQLNQRYVYRAFLDLNQVPCLVFPINEPVPWYRAAWDLVKKGVARLQAQKATPADPVKKGNPFSKVLKWIVIGLFGIAITISLGNATIAIMTLHWRDAALFLVALVGSFIGFWLVLSLDKQPEGPTPGPRYNSAVKLVGSWFTENGRPLVLKTFDLVKNAKLRERHLKFKNGTADLRGVLVHLSEEMTELLDALAEGKEPEEVRREMADVSNCLDIAFALVEWGALGPVMNETQIYSH